MTAARDPQPIHPDGVPAFTRGEQVSAGRECRDTRVVLGWSERRLAQASGVEVASVYLLERLGSAGSNDDARIRTAIACEFRRRTLSVNLAAASLLHRRLVDEPKWEWERERAPAGQPRQPAVRR